MNRKHFLILLIALTACDFYEYGPAPAANEFQAASIDFTYRKGNDFPGIVRFYNNSIALTNYKWEFGYLDEDGEPATSKGGSPLVYYPANGNYAVTLTGQDKDENLFELSQSIAITSVPD